jgi:hypothetical protein
MQQMCKNPWVMLTHTNRAARAHVVLTLVPHLQRPRGSLCWNESPSTRPTTAKTKRFKKYKSRRIVIVLWDPITRSGCRLFLGPESGNNEIGSLWRVFIVGVIP